MSDSRDVTGASASGGVPPFTQDVEYWYSDGTVILLARAKVAFRVHKGILADHSAIFGDLFAVSQPEDGEWYADCPIVTLSDAPGEVRWFLKALYHPRRHYMPDRRVPFAMVAALIRLGHKYAIDDLVSSALSRLSTCFPTDFDAYCASITSGGSQVLTCTPEDAITAVNLARLLGDDARMILPSAFYTCCQLGADILIRGVANEDGDLEKLCDADLGRCVDARARLAALALSSTMRRCQLNTERPSDSGGRKENDAHCVQAFCAPYLAAAATRVLNKSLGLPTLCGALDTMEGFVNDSVRGGLLCRVCAESVKAKDRQERLWVWKTLPTVLDLQIESWGECDQEKL